MSNPDRASLGQSNDLIKSSLTCSCGFFTSHSDYMLLHLKEGRAECEWSDGQRALVMQAMKRLDIEMQVARQTLMQGEVELGYLRKIFQHKKEAVRAKPRRCNVCGKKTSEMFGDIPQCLKHTKSDPQFANRVASILEDFLYGK